MRDRRLVVVTLCLATALAGCGGLGADQRERSTLSPAPVPTETPVGLSADGIDADALAATHESVLLGTNYTVRVTERFVANGTVRREATRRRRVAVGARAYSIARTERTDQFPSTAIGSDIGYWFSGNATYERIGRGDSARYRRYPGGPPGPLLDPTSHVGIAQIVGAFELRPSGETDGSRRFASTELVTPATVPTPNFVGTPRNASLTVRVAPAGYVRSYRLRYEANTSATDGRIRVRRDVAFSNVGTTTVTAPEWVTAARERPGVSRD